MIDNTTYSRNKTKALIEIGEYYRKLENGLLKYRTFKSNVKRIFKKYGSKYEKNEIGDYLYYVDINKKRYYGQSFVAGDFDVQFIIDINLVDFKYEEVNNIDEIIKGDFLQECFVDCIHDGSISNFDNDY